MFEEMELKRLRLGRGRGVYVYGLWKSYERAGALVVVNQFLSFSVLFPVSLFLGNTFCFVIVLYHRDSGFLSFFFFFFTQELTNYS